MDAVLVCDELTIGRVNIPGFTLPQSGLVVIKWPLPLATKEEENFLEALCRLKISGGTDRPQSLGIVNDFIGKYAFGKRLARMAIRKMLRSLGNDELELWQREFPPSVLPASTKLDQVSWDVKRYLQILHASSLYSAMVVNAAGLPPQSIQKLSHLITELRTLGRSFIYMRYPAVGLGAGLNEIESPNTIEPYVV